MSRRLALFLALVLVAPLAPAADRAAETELDRALASERAITVRSHDGVLRDAFNLALQTGTAAPEAIDAFVASRPRQIIFDDGIDVRASMVRESLTGIHREYRQYVDGLELLDSSLVITATNEGQIRTIHNRLDAAPLVRGSLDADAAFDHLRLQVPAVVAERVLLRDEVALRVGPSIHRAHRFVADVGAERYAWIIDTTSGELLRVEPMFFSAEARIFDPNPVSALNQPALRDMANAAAAVPESAYRVVDIAVPQSGPLRGPNVEIVDLELPATTPADVSQPLDFDRSHHGFEEVMTYYHLDRAQRYLQSLGFVGAKRILNRSLKADAHAGGGDDNSYYKWIVPGQGSLYFGDGGVDDAEDADILVHEFAHALQDSIAPGAFSGSFRTQARALGEGFGDYWAFSSSYDVNTLTGRDPYCIADWDARCSEDGNNRCNYPAETDCLRRVDSKATMDDYLDVSSNGVEHRNGTIWSSALREIFEALVARHGSAAGKEIADRTIVESHFGMPPVPTFATAARKLLEAERFLSGGANADVICSAMTLRKILTPAECSQKPRGEMTFFVSPDRELLIPDSRFQSLRSVRRIDDSRPIDTIAVRIDIEHSRRGELEISLLAPDGTGARLKSLNSDEVDSLHVTYGIDADPAESLEVFRGKPAAGDWTLQIVDTATRDVGKLIGWSLLIRFAGDEALETRSAFEQPVLTIPAVANAPGAEGTSFNSDVRIFNRGSVVATGTLFFTPSSADGRTEFAAISISIDPGQTLSLDDVVSRDFRSAGLGTLQLVTGGRDLTMTSRVRTTSPAGEFGEFSDAISFDATTSQSRPPLDLFPLRRNAQFRSNIGLAELAGEAGVVRLDYIDANGTLISSEELEIAPFSHRQQPALLGATSDLFRVEVRVISGGARVGAYASLIDNQTGDGSYIAGVPRAQSDSPRQRSVLPAVIHAEGAAGTSWNSDVWLFNSAPTAASATLSFYRSTGGEPVARSVRISARSITMIEDVVRSLFADEGGGQIQIDAAPQVKIMSRTWNSGKSGGSFGQFIPTRAASDAVATGTIAHAIQLESSTGARTNVGFAEVANEPAVVRIRLFDDAGVERWSKDFSIDANGHRQISLALEGAPHFVGGRLSFDVIAGSGRLLPYASVVDNSSGDPFYVPAR